MVFRQPRPPVPGNRSSFPAYTSGQTYLGYIATLTQPLVWYKITETSGTTATNAGTASSANGTYSAVTLGVTGQLGANNAGTWNATTSVLTAASNAAFNGLSAFTFGFLVNLATAGEGTGASWMRFWENSSGDQIFFDTTTFRIAVQFNGTTSGTATSNISLFTASTWQWVFVTLDTAGDWKPRIYRGISGSASEMTYSTAPAAGTGSKTSNAVTKYIGNRNGNDRTADGQFDEFLLFGYVLSGTEMTNITLYSGA